MQQVLLIIHLLIALSLVGVVLIQRSEGGGLGIGGGGGGGGGGGLMSVRGTANLLTRATGVLAACFMVTSMALAIISSRASDGTSVFDSVPAVVDQSAPGDGTTDGPVQETEPATNVPLD